MDLDSLFIDITEKHFKYLTENFDFVHYKSNNEIWNLYVRYKSPKIGISVEFELRDRDVSLIIYKLDGEDFPDDSKTKTYDDSIVFFDFDNLLNFKKVDFQEFRKLRRRFRKEDFNGVLEQIIIKYATLLKEYASDILVGNTDTLKKMTQLESNS